MPKPIKIASINPKQAATLTDEAAQAVAQYQEWMKREHHTEISIRRAIPALIELGWQYIKDAESEAAK
jgi:hypothetical protein